MVSAEPVLYGLFLGGALFCLAAVVTGLALGIPLSAVLKFERREPSTRTNRHAVPYLAGAAAVYVVPVLLFTVSFATVEVPSARIRVENGSPAQLAGLRDGDRIVAVDGAPVETFVALVDRIRPQLAANEPMRLTIADRGTFTVTPTAGRLGVVATGERVRAHTWGGALARSVGAPFRNLVASVRTVSTLLVGDQPFESMGGPVALVSDGPPGHSNRSTYWVSLVAVLLSTVWPVYLLLGIAGAWIVTSRTRGGSRARSRS